MKKTHEERLSLWKAKRNSSRSYVSKEDIKRISSEIDSVLYGHKKIIRDKFI